MADYTRDEQIGCRRNAATRHLDAIAEYEDDMEDDE